MTPKLLMGAGFAGLAYLTYHSMQMKNNQQAYSLQG
jgi:hypothetical protein